MNYFNDERITVSLDEMRKNNLPSTRNITDTYMIYECLEDTKSEFNEDKILESIIIKEELDKLTPHQKEILFMCFVDDMTQYDIAESLQINQSNVSRAKKRGIQSIREGISPLDVQSDSF
jgi:RNA polymerase sigma factor (sigma-70 family)